MTPKEKAQELYDKAEGYIYTSNAHLADDNCEKNCALLVVDSILRELRKHICVIDDSYIYWENVRNELNKL